MKDKIVYADNIAQAAQFAQTGNAEIGFLAMALVMALRNERRLLYFGYQKLQTGRTSYGSIKR